MAEVETITPKGATKAILKRVVIGAAVGGVQVLAEDNDAKSGKAPDSIRALQNLVPISLTAIGAVLTVVPKKNNLRTIGADIVSSSSALLAYRGFSELLKRQGTGTRRLRGLSRTSGRAQSVQSSVGNYNLF